MDSEVSEYDILFGDLEFPYNQKIQNFIRGQRSKLSGSLFFDLLCSNIVGIQDVHLVYPPAKGEVLRDLFEQIDSANSDLLKKQLLLYYILKDFGLQNAKEFSEQVLLPEAHKMLIDGVYYLDRFEFKSAMTMLTSPAVHLQFSEKILSTLLRYSDNGSHYIRIYVACKKPALDTPTSMTLYLDAICKISVSSALEYIRAIPSQDRPEYIQKMLDFSLSTNSSEVAYQIANLPLAYDEEEILMEYLSGRQDITAKNIAIVRELHRGHTQNAQKIAQSMNKQLSTGTKSTFQSVDLAKKLRANASKI
ncbi:nuclear pore complex assembly-domain-containing protein, partial [Lipomyces oligophaga]|uniref:nuclear pore complex assembly-domain-containing protein n=1 Tax=Lipomyces oligophaga TaxID=45792 RepID=UPI0034D00A61